jgi:hypothetical protein
LHHVFVTNYWDGEAYIAHSKLYSFEPSTGSVSHLQSVKTAGGRASALVSVSDSAFLAVASFAASTVIFPWNGTVLAPGFEGDLITAEGYGGTELIPGVSGATGLAHFTTLGADSSMMSYLAVSRASAPSLLFSLSLSSDGSLIAASGIPFGPQSGARALSTFVVNGTRFIAVAIADDGASGQVRMSELLKWSSPRDGGAGTGAFVHYQWLQTRNCQGISHFESREGHFLLASQSGNGEDHSLMLRWNGTLFLSFLDSTTLPVDTAGGQRILFPSLAAKHLTSPGGDDVLLVSPFSPPAPSERAVRAMGSHETVDILDGPASVTLSPSGNMVYVGLRNSRAIVGFDRDTLTGVLKVNGAAGYFTNYSLENAWGLEGVQDADDYPLRGLSSIAVSPGRLYAASTLSNTLSAFDIGAGGELNLTAVVEDGDGGGSVDGLSGASSVAVDNTDVGRVIVYVTALGDQSVAAFSDYGGPNLTFVDLVKNGERLLGGFLRPGPTLDVVPEYDEDDERCSLQNSDTQSFVSYSLRLDRDEFVFT